VPAAAVIPAPIAYIKVVAGKKLVVGSHKSLFQLDATASRLPRLAASSDYYLFAGDLTWCPSSGATAAQ
jgi:hypothetical protein